MAYINIPLKDNTTPLTPTEFNYLIDKLNARKLRDLIDVQDSDAVNKNIIRHNGSGWVFYNIEDDFYTKNDIDTALGGSLGDINIAPAWGEITGVIRDQLDLVANFGDLKSLNNIWDGEHYAKNYILTGSGASSGSTNFFYISDDVNTTTISDEQTLTIKGDIVNFDFATKTYTINGGSQTSYDYIDFSTDQTDLAWK